MTINETPFGSSGSAECLRRRPRSRQNPRMPNNVRRFSGASRRLAFSLLAIGLVAPALARAQQPVDMRALQDEAVANLEQYIRINTTNPPGNEVRTMKFFADIFTKEGIPFETAESAPGRGNIWARLKGGPSRRCSS